MRYLLTALLVLGIGACDSSVPTDPTVPEPIDTITDHPVVETLAGSWVGTLTVIYDSGADSPRAYEVPFWIEFADSVYTYQGNGFAGCVTYGAGDYSIDSLTLALNYWGFCQTPCVHALGGPFSYALDTAGCFLTLTQDTGGDLWRIEVIPGSPPG